MVYYSDRFVMAGVFSFNERYLMDKEQEKSSGHVCGLPVECWSRCCGYYRPVKNWNHGKKEEFKDRLTFNVKQAAAACGCYSKVK